MYVRIVIWKGVMNYKNSIIEVRDKPITPKWSRHISELEVSQANKQQAKRSEQSKETERYDNASRDWNGVSGATHVTYESKIFISSE